MNSAEYRYWQDGNLIRLDVTNLNRSDGLIGSRIRRLPLTPEQRSELARARAYARWGTQDKRMPLRERWGTK